MDCKCGVRGRSKSLGGEVALHFPGRDGLDKPLVWVFPQVSVCLECGAAQFNVPEDELQVLAEGGSVRKPVSSAA